MAIVSVWTDVTKSRFSCFFSKDNKICGFLQARDILTWNIIGLTYFSIDTQTANKILADGEIDGKVLF